MLERGPLGGDIVPGDEDASSDAKEGGPVVGRGYDDGPVDIREGERAQRARGDEKRGELLVRRDRRHERRRRLQREVEGELEDFGEGLDGQGEPGKTWGR